VAGCGASNNNPDGGGHDADFTVCAGSDAGPYAPGVIERSQGGGFDVTLTDAERSGMALSSGPGVGLNTFTFVLRDAAGAVPVGMTVTAEKPYMPKHMHGATTFPTVTDQGDGTFVVSEINFFMPGYWELTLDLSPSSVGGDAPATSDKVVFSVCVPS
jgi:hypothetical protein